MRVSPEAHLYAMHGPARTARYRRLEQGHDAQRDEEEEAEAARVAAELPDLADRFVRVGCP